MMDVNRPIDCGKIGRQMEHRFLWLDWKKMEPVGLPIERQPEFHFNANKQVDLWRVRIFPAVNVERWEKVTNGATYEVFCAHEDQTLVELIYRSAGPRREETPEPPLLEETNGDDDVL